MKRWLYRPWAVVLTTVLLIALDQVTKGLAVRYLKGKDAFVLWRGVFELRYLENRGAALGCFRDSGFSFCSRGCWFLRQFFISSGMCLKIGVSGPFV